MPKKEDKRHAPKGEDVRLSKKESKSLGKKGSVVNIKKGQAWVTAEGEDQVVQEGESIDLKSSKASAIISQVGKESMIFEVDDENAEENQ